MKKTITLVSASLALVAGANAATLAFTNMRHGGIEAGSVLNIDGGTDIAISNNAAGAGTGDVNARQQTYTINGLDLDGVGTNDDSIEVIINYVPVGGTVTVSSGSAGVSGNGDGLISSTVETLTYSFTSATVTLGNGGAATADFLGFSGAHFVSYGDGSRHTLGLDGGLAVEGDANATADVATFAFADTVAVGYGATSTDSFRMGGTSFSIEVTAVPEPSSTVLLGLGGLALILRRRK